MTLRALLLALAGLLAVAAPAVADEPVAPIDADMPIAAHGGWVAWSEPSGARYRLVLRTPQGERVVPRIASSPRPFDVSLGPDERRNVVAVYQRCAGGGCDIRRYSTASGRDVLLREASSPNFDESTPAIWGRTVAFTREIEDCDIPYVKTLGSRAPSRRLLGRSRCVGTPAGHLAIRADKVVTSSVDYTDAEETNVAQSQIRVFSTRGGASEVVLRANFAEETHLFGQVALDANQITTVRYGIQPQHAFVRVRYAGGTAANVPARTNLTGAFAKSGAGTGFYVEGQGFEIEPCSGAIPCRLIAQPHSPFGRQVRALAPRLTVEYVTDREGSPRQGRPLPFRGRLTRQVVQDGRIIRTDPVAGVAVRLLRRDSEDDYEETTYRGATDADGRYEIVVPPPIPREPWFTAVASTPGAETWAGSGTVGRSAP